MEVSLYYTNYCLSECKVSCKVQVAIVFSLLRSSLRVCLNGVGSVTINVINVCSVSTITLFPRMRNM